MLMAHHLAADRGERTAEMLEQAVVVMTPMSNPSSHERWTSWSNSFAAGPTGNADPLAMEHNPPWGVGTNYNHYLVDINRESLWGTQQEAAALAAAVQAAGYPFVEIDTLDAPALAGVDALLLTVATSADSAVLWQIGDLLSVTESRVCQIHGQAVLRLRSRLRDWRDMH